MGTVIRGGLRDFVRRFFGDLAAISEDGPCANLQAVDLGRDTDAFLDDLERLVVELTHIKGDIKDPSIPEKVREAFFFLDEFASIIIEDYLTTALKGLRDKYQAEYALGALLDVDARLERIIIGQQQHRMAMKYPSLLEFNDNNRMLPYRRGVLKKFISSILHLNVEVSEWEIHRQLYFAVSAALAMFIGAVAIVIAQNRYATTSWPFITVVVLTYVFRDRLKDLLRQNFSKRMARWIADRRTHIKDPVSGATIGNLKEAFSFIDGSSTVTLAFNADISGWNVSNVTSMDSMFTSTRQFNRNIGGWNVSKVTNMGSMFASAFAFNQNLSSWNVAAVTAMDSMFAGATAFNGDIIGWNTGAVTNMSSMFNNANLFNRNIGGWNVTKVTNMGSMFAGVTLPVDTYDAILNGWAAQAVHAAVPFHGGTSYYSAASAAARATLTGTYNWTIADIGLLQ